MLTDPSSQSAIRGREMNEVPVDGLAVLGLCILAIIFVVIAARSKLAPRLTDEEKERVRQRYAEEKRQRQAALQRVEREEALKKKQRKERAKHFKEQERLRSGKEQ